nr:hypothetical protein [Nocardia miyunensis]
MEKLELTGLLGAESKLPGEISGGMRKRAGLARALVDRPVSLRDGVAQKGQDRKLLRPEGRDRIDGMVATRNAVIINGIRSPTARGVAPKWANR